MCGITGFITATPNFADNLSNISRRMVDVIAQRGPDDSGVWVDQQHGIALGHRRLSILDLSAAGHQPMHSTCGRFVLVFNGEIYNHQKIRLQLTSGSQQLIKWRGNSDTETLLAAFAMWGIDKTLKTCVGMFAIALWDRHKKMLTLARDRMGEKPLYFGWQGDTFMFASELKALKKHPEFRNDVDRQALTLLLRFNYIPAPFCIYQGISKLHPGTYLNIPFGQSAERARNTQNVPYWSLREVAENGQSDPFSGSDDEAQNLLEARLGDAIEGQQLSDVPLGAFLSGGIDSSLVVALMQSRSPQPVKTFTIGFNESEYNEAEHAKAVATHLGTDHTELYLSPQDALNVIPRLPFLYDEPFADASQIPTFLLAQMARQHVTVALSGDGGDELFGGYNRHTWSRSIRQKTGWMPSPLRLGLGSVICAISPAGWDRFNNHCGQLMPLRYRTVQMGEKMHKLAGFLAADDDAALYRKLVSQWLEPSEVVIDGSEPLQSDFSKQMPFKDIEHSMMLMDALTYLPDDILCKVDRAAMGVSLETRMPILDHRVVDLAWRLPLNMKIRQGQGKWLLRQLLDKFVPREIIERPKQGFALPIDTWLRGPLREWAEALLNESRLNSEGYFKVRPVRQAWEEHLSGKNRHFQLWGILMFQAWLEENR